MLLDKLTKLTALTLDFVAVAAALEHLGLLTRLQDLSLAVTVHWAAAGCPGLRELKALTRLQVQGCARDISPSISQLTALQQLEVPETTLTALNQLLELTGLTRLRVEYLDTYLLEGLSPGSPSLQLSGLRHLEVLHGLGGTRCAMPVSILASCTQLQVLTLCDINLSGPGSLVASSVLQRLELDDCRLCAADGATGPVSWQQVFPGPGQLPHLTLLSVSSPKPPLEHADMECVVACCSSLQVLHLDTLQDSFASALKRLPGLISLYLWKVSDQQCSSLAQLTGLRELRVVNASGVCAAGLQQLAALEQLTSLGLHFLGWSSDVLREHMSDRLPGPFTYKYAMVNQAPAGHPPDALLGCGGRVTWLLLLRDEAARVMLRPNRWLKVMLQSREAAAAALVARAGCFSAAAAAAAGAGAGASGIECCNSDSAALSPAWQGQHENALWGSATVAAARTAAEVVQL